MAGKFKVGNIVRLLVDDSLDSLTKKGEIGVIVSGADSGDPLVHVGQGTPEESEWYIEEKDMELVEYQGESDE